MDGSPPIWGSAGLLRLWPVGALEVIKSVGGTGVGFHGGVVIEATCEDPDGELNQTFTRSLDARSAAAVRNIYVPQGIVLSEGGGRMLPATSAVAA